MKIAGAITMLAGEKGLSIEIHDKSSHTTFCRIQLTPVQFAQAMGRLAYTETEKMEVFALDRVGKKEETMRVEYPLPHGTKSRDKKIGIEVIETNCPEGWVADIYLNSQGSFTTKDDIQYVHTIIRRWVENELVVEDVVGCEDIK
jgi:hypothetical protein